MQTDIAYVPSGKDFFFSRNIPSTWVSCKTIDNSVYMAK